MNTFTGNRQKSKIPMKSFKWLYWVDAISIMAASAAFGIILSLSRNTFAEKNIGFLMATMIPPMIVAMIINTFVIMHFVRSKMEELLDSLNAVAEGNLNTELKENKTDEFQPIYHMFNRMVTEVKLSKEKMDSFVNEYSHEFKTPISSIKGLAQYLEKNFDKIPREEREQYLHTIAEESSRLSNLSGNMLFLSKLEATQILTDREKFRLDEQIRHCLIVMLPKLEKKKIKYDIECDDLEYFGNSTFLEQVWINLISNAIRYTGEGGNIRIVLEDIRNRNEDYSCIVTVEDDGIGMNEETFKHIFDKYYQANGDHGGNGIGLSIVKRIVALHGGKIEVESAPGEGAAFKIFL